MPLTGFLTHSPRTRLILRFTLGYGLFASMWVLFSDLLLTGLGDITHMVWLSATKGMLFVLVSTLLLFLALRTVSNFERRDPEGRDPAPSELQAAAEAPIKLSRSFIYLFSLLLSLSFLVVRSEISVSYADASLLVMFMFPIILSAMLGGMGPGLLATAVTALGVGLQTLSPRHGLPISEPHALFQWGFLIANGLLVSWLSELFHSVMSRLAAEHRLQVTILSSIGDGVIKADPQGRVAFMNREAQKLTGRTSEQAVGQPLSTVFNPAAEQGVAEQGASAIDAAMQTVLQSRQSMQLELAGLQLDKEGHGLSLAITLSPIEPLDQQATGVVLVLRYDGEQKRMERALRENNALLEEMSELAHIGGWSFDPRTGDGEWTDEVARIHEVEPRTHPSADFGLSFYQGGSRQKLETALQRALEQGTPYDLELELVTARGNRRWVRAVAAPVVEAGRVLRVRGAIQDITDRRQTEDALRANKRLLARVIEGSDQGFWDWDLQTRQFNVSARFESMLGYAPDERTLTSDDWPQLVHPDDLTKAMASLERHIRGEIPHHEVEIRCRTKSGDWKWILTRGKVVVRDAEGKPLIMSGTHTDISRRKQAELALRQAAAVFENTREGVVVTDAQVRIVQVNRAFTELTGYSEAEVLGKKPSLLNSGRNGPELYAQVWKSIADTGFWQGELWNRRKNGEIFPELLSISAVKDDAGKVINYVSVFTDISNLKASEERLDFLAHHDPLTQLPNRLRLFSHLNHALAQSARNGGCLALLMLDLDRFKYVNDSFGHLMGDQLLQQVAERIAKRLRGADLIARLGGDEFTVLLDDMYRPEDAARVAELLLTLLQAPFHLTDSIEVRTSASIGISLFPEHGSTPEILLQQADAAMYRAKSQGGGRFEYFSESMTLAARERILMDARLRQAIRNDELRVYYQPQVDIGSGLIVGAEALVRWQDEKEGLIPPGRFIPIAEETGLIREIGRWVLREACHQGRRWLDAGYPPITLAVNVAAHQIHNGDFVEVVESVLAETGYPAGLLELELTESALMETRDEVTALLNRLRAHHIRLAIDDFGTGYSSLSYLKRFPLDVLKVDKSFVDDIAFDRDDREIVMAIIEMGHTLGIKVLAEGVETSEQLAFLTTKGCDLYQGYIFSRPLPADEFERLLQAI